MRDYIRLQLKLKWGLNRNNSKSSALMTAFATVLAIAVVLALVWALTYVLKANLTSTVKQLFELYLTLIMLGLTVFATGMQIGRLYRPADIKITARFPLSPFKLFASELILNYIQLWIYSTMLLLPVMLVFGFAASCFTLNYFFGMLLGILLLPMLPFALSVIIAMPVMYVTVFFERYGLVRLIAFVLFLAGCFVLYYYILKVLAQFFIHRNWETGTLEIWEALLTRLDAYYNPAYYLANVIFFENFWLGFGVLLGAVAVLLAGGVALARIVCANMRYRALDHFGGGVTRRSSLDDSGSAWSIFRHTFMEMYRSKTYSYFFLGVAISTPVMVFFCNRLVEMVGEAAIGTGINFGAAVLVISVFMSMICSFTGEILSVEGKNFYITKLVPVSYRKQLLVKGSLNICVGLAALLISSVIIAYLKFLEPLDMLMFLISEVLFVAGLVFNGINLNLSNPNLKPKANGEAEEINIIYMLLIGFVLSAVFGAGCLLLPKTTVNGNLWAYLLLAGVAFVYALVNVVIFFATADRKYRNIEG